MKRRKNTAKKAAAQKTETKNLPTVVRENMVDFANSMADCLCIILGSLGMSDKCIEKCTGLIPTQISYRLALMGISRKAYRDGESIIGKAVVNGCKNAANAQTERLAELIRGRTKMNVRAVGNRIVLMDDRMRDMILGTMTPTPRLKNGNA